MTDPADYTARIRAKGLDNTGITEDYAAHLYRQKGSRVMAIVELKVDETHEKADGTRRVDLIITQLEPTPIDDTADMAEHLRELTRTIYYNRGLDGHTSTTTEGQERTVADVLASGQSMRPHPFLPDDAAKDTPICDVCGGIEPSAVHSVQDLIDDPAEDPDNELDEPHRDDEDKADPVDDLDRQLAAVPDPFTPTPA